MTAATEGVRKGKRGQATSSVRWVLHFMDIRCDAYSEARVTLIQSRWAGIGRTLAANFPTLFSTAGGVAGLIAGPSRTLRSLDFERGLLAHSVRRLRASSGEPDQDTHVIPSPRLGRLAPGRPPQIAVR
jgi:hypothetical protein